MDYIFDIVDEGARASLLQNLVRSSGCTYICLWQSNLPQHSNHLYLEYFYNSTWLISTDGFYNEENNIKQQPIASSSSGSHARRLFDQYRQSIVAVQNIEYDTNPSRVPGHAFKNSVPFMELKDLDLQRRASVEAQLQFYQEARIKNAVFMGCMTGEIELGFSDDTTQVNWEMEMRKWIPENFAPFRDLPPPPPDHQIARASSSSSSLRSLSTDNSLDPSPFLFNFPNTFYNPQEPAATKQQPPIQEQQALLRPTSSSLVLASPLHQAIQSFNQTRNIPFVTHETEDDAITKAIIAVLSSPSPSTSPSSSVAQNFPFFSRNARSAFNTYRSSLAHSSSSTPGIGKVRRSSNMFKKVISFFRSLSVMRNQGRVQQVHGSRPTENQLYHMISERKRREKLNESFQALRSLLPPGTKKDKASVLSGTSEYLNTLRSQVVELTRRNQILEAQLILPKTKPRDHDQEVSESSSNQRLDVRVVNAAAESSSSEARIVDLHVVVTGECNILELVIRLLEFLKKDERVSFISVEADTEESHSVIRVVSRLKIEGTDWDESIFQEAVGRVVADLAK